MRMRMPFIALVSLLGCTQSAPAGDAGPPLPNTCVEGPSCFCLPTGADLNCRPFDGTCAACKFHLRCAGCGNVDLCGNDDHAAELPPSRCVVSPGFSPDGGLDLVPDGGYSGWVAVPHWTWVAGGCATAPAYQFNQCPDGKDGLRAYDPYCVPGSAVEECQKVLPPPGGPPDGGCGKVLLYPARTIHGCTEPLPDGGFYLADGGINRVPDGGWSHYAIQLGRYEHCPWLNGLAPYDCAAGGSFAVFCVTPRGQCAMSLPANMSADAGGGG